MYRLKMSFVLSRWEIHGGKVSHRFPGTVRDDVNHQEVCWLRFTRNVLFPEKRMARTKERMNGENSEKDENSCTDTENAAHHLLLPAALQIVR